MKKPKTVALTTILALAGFCLLAAGDAQAWVNGTLRDPPGGGFNNWSGCRLDVGTGLNRVRFDSNCNWLGGNINIAPFAGCTTQVGGYYTYLEVNCNDGNWWSDSRNGTNTTNGDILLGCGGGAWQAYYYVDSN